jgi:type II secretory pathway component PulF
MGEPAMVTSGRNVFRFRGFVVGVAQSLLLVALGAAALKVVPNFEKVFRELKSDLPDTTIAVLDSCHFLRQHWYPAFLLVLMWPFVDYGVVSLLWRRPELVGLRRLWYFTTWGVIVVVALFAMFALFRPLLVLITSLSHVPVVPPG